MRKIIGVGETILDIIFKDNKPLKAIPGGSVFNGLVSLARLGVEVKFISEVGYDEVGKIIRNFMDDNHLCAAYLDDLHDGQSPVSLAFLDNENNAKYAFYKNYPAKRLDILMPKINEDDIFIFGSYYSLNKDIRPQILEMLDYARSRKAIIYYDPNFRKAHAHEAIFVTPTVLDNLEYADIVRGSDEDFINLFKLSDSQKVYEDHIKFHCHQFLVTHGSKGIDLFTDSFTKHYDAPTSKAVSTIGAGDNFNAGILFGLLKYDVHRDDLPTLSEAVWDKLIASGNALASEVCKNYDNYISPAFAKAFLEQS